MTDIIGYKDNFFSDPTFSMLAEYASKAQYTWGEVDTMDTIPTGMVHNIEEDSDIWDIITTRIEEICPFTESMSPQRVYINCFAPTEIPYFHTDSHKGGATFIYYLNPWSLNDGGCTEILINNEIRAFLPLPNRMVWFDSTLQHRATTRRDVHRFAYAIKYL